MQALVSGILARIAVASVVLILPILVPVQAVAAEPVPLVVRPVPAGAMDGCDAAKLDKALARDFAKSKRYRVVPEGTPGAVIMEIRRCIQKQGTPRLVPSGGGAADRGSTGSSEQVSSMRRDFGPYVTIQFRLAGTRSLDIASRGYAYSMEEAALRLKEVVESTLKEDPTALGTRTASPAPPR